MTLPGFASVAIRQGTVPTTPSREVGSLAKGGTRLIVKPLGREEVGQYELLQPCLQHVRWHSLAFRVLVRNRTTNLQVLHKVCAAWIQMRPKRIKCVHDICVQMRSVVDNGIKVASRHLDPPLENRRILLVANERVDSLLQHRDLMLHDAPLIDVCLPELCIGEQLAPEQSARTGSIIHGATKADFEHLRRTPRVLKHWDEEEPVHYVILMA